MKPTEEQTMQMLFAFMIVIFVVLCYCTDHITKQREFDTRHKIAQEVLKTIHEESRDTSEFPAVYVGKFKFTHYCSCPICTRKSKPGLTKIESKPHQGRTIAVDPKKIPLHSIVYIEDMGYFVAEDIGGGVKGNHIDIYVDDHEEATRLGTLGGAKRRVWIMKQTEL